MLSFVLLRMERPRVLDCSLFYSVGGSTMTHGTKSYPVTLYSYMSPLGLGQHPSVPFDGVLLRMITALDFLLFFNRVTSFPLLTQGPSPPPVHLSRPFSSLPTMDVPGLPLSHVGFPKFRVGCVGPVHCTENSRGDRMPTRVIMGSLTELKYCLSLRWFMDTN